MKKLTYVFPALLFAAAAVLCLSFDLNGQLNTKDGVYEKAVYDKCADGITNTIECQTGGTQCAELTCPTTVITEAI